MDQAIPIPAAAPDRGGNEEKDVGEALRRFWISSAGAFVTRFEVQLAELWGSRSAVSVCNGTVALHLALLGFDVRSGDEVLVPSRASLRPRMRSGMSGASRSLSMSTPKPGASTYPAPSRESVASPPASVVAERLC